MSLLPAVGAYKILFFVPQLSNSQTLINYRLAEVLAKHGHQVTMYRPVYHPMVKGGKSELVKTVKVAGVRNETAFMELQDQMNGESVFGPTTFSFSMFNSFFDTFVDACENQIENVKVIEELKAEKFDLAFAHHYDVCPFGLMRLMGIKTYIWFVSGPLPEYMAGLVGAPQAPSYVPNIMSAMTDRMTPFERLKNGVGIGLQTWVVDHFVVKRQTEVFRKHHGKDFPSLSHLAAQSPLVFVNSEELLDFPRPLLHKIIYMGGIGMRDGPKAKAEMLEPKQLRGFVEGAQKGIVYISFGSVANTTHMPLSWLETFSGTAAALPNLRFILKCDRKRASADPSLLSAPNVYVGEWLPQRDILAHPKTLAFVTHGGFNSYLESSFAGVPMVPIPLFGDQWANAKRGERHGMAIALDKLSLSAQLLTDALSTITQEPSYMENAKRLSGMLRKKPLKAEDVFLGWVEFLAEYKELPNLEPFAIQQSWLEYNLWDVMAGVSITALLLFWLFQRTLRTYYWWCCTSYTPQASHHKRD